MHAQRGGREGGDLGEGVRGVPTLSPQTHFGLVWGGDFWLLRLGWRVEAGEEVGPQVPTDTPHSELCLHVPRDEGPRSHSWGGAAPKAPNPSTAPTRPVTLRGRIFRGGLDLRGCACPCGPTPPPRWLCWPGLWPRQPGGGEVDPRSYKALLCPWELVRTSRQSLVREGPKWAGGQRGGSKDCSKVRMALPGLAPWIERQSSD